MDKEQILETLNENIVEASQESANQTFKKHAFTQSQEGRARCIQKDLYLAASCFYLCNCSTFFGST